MATLIVLAWLAVGFAILVWLSTRPDLAEFLEQLVAIVLWPAVLVAQIMRRRDRRRAEAERQAHITAKVAAGEYTTQQARRLGWDGGDTDD